jgi:FlaA1/EpsC-like NDP-sugar epimerase
MLLLMAAAPVIGVATFYVRGLYRLVTRFIGPEGSTRIYIAVFIASVLWALAVLMSGIQGNPRSVVVIYGLIAAGLIRLSRQWAAAILTNALPRPTVAGSAERKPVIIYGAGTVGIQLLRALNDTGQYDTVALIDDTPTLAGQMVHGVRVLHSEKIGRVIAEHGVKEVMLAMPSALRSERRLAIKALEPYPVVVKTLPALEEIASGHVEISDLRLIDVEDLLGRDPVVPDGELLAAKVRDKVVMVTGAGGSIGSELTRQLLALGPKTLVLLELSEVALYEIAAEIEDLKRRRRKEAETAGLADTTIAAVLGSVLDRKAVARIIEEYGVEIIYHAAAYKHVPIVEANPFVGLHNNTFGTLTLAEIAKELGVRRFVLVSTDKAVRPTNVMGASKRLAELILQAMAEQRDAKTVFTMVRFGNVLDSSGSVVRRFRKQIHEGGPVTVTHPDIIRYFMSIPEAAQLVIQAGAMATGGEVFVLEMGTPVKIDDLARTMIRLSGLEVRDEKNPEGDIAVQYVGLRQGEKLYEELLIGENTTGTSHPRIFKNSEPFLSYQDLASALAQLEDAILRHDEGALQKLLRATVEGYAPSAAPQAVVKEDWQPVSRMLH